MSDIREEFELTVRETWSDSYSFMRDTDGHYGDEVLDGMWWAWQAARAQGDSEPAKVTSEMKAECMGEFSWQEEAPYYDEDGEIHDYVATHVVPWDICKQIYKRMASCAPPKAQAVPESIEAAIYMLEDYASALENGDLDGAGHSTTSCIHEVIDQLATAPQPPQEGSGDA